jgi:superfamily II DNA/RNA helicase
VPSLPLGLTGAFEDTSFASLSNLVNENTLNAIEEMGFKHMTVIQPKKYQATSGRLRKPAVAKPSLSSSL